MTWHEARTEAEPRAFAEVLAADAEQLAAGIGDLSRPYPADALDHVGDLERPERHMVEQAIEREVTGATVADFPLGS